MRMIIYHLPSFYDEVINPAQLSPSMHRRPLEVLLVEARPVRAPTSSGTAGLDLLSKSTQRQVSSIPTVVSLLKFLSMPSTKPNHILTHEHHNNAHHRPRQNKPQPARHNTKYLPEHVPITPHKGPAIAQ